MIDHKVYDISRLRHYPQFHSSYIPDRRIAVWLPPCFQEKNSLTYPVVYMHDGQFLFSSVGEDLRWEVDATMERLVASGAVEPAIIVGIWNTDDRMCEYAPQRPVETYLTSKDQDNLRNTGYFPTGDDYLRFLVEELKPFIESSFPVTTNSQKTFIMGSSMGGIISAYAVCEYPDIFGGAACLSPHWPICGGVMVRYLKDNLPDPQTHKFYFDYGTRSVDVQYIEFQAQVDRIMYNAGYVNDKNWLTSTYPGDDHSADAWGSRAHVPLSFLLKNPE